MWKKRFALALLLCTLTNSAFADKLLNYPDVGNVNPTDNIPVVRGLANGVTHIPLASTTTAGLSECGSGISCAGGVLNATTTANGVTGSPQIDNGGSLYGAPIPSELFYTPPATAADALRAINAKAFAAISSGLEIDPRGYGAQCTGWAGLASASVFSGGAGFAVNDKFLVADDNYENILAGGVVAAGHVTSVDGSGAVTGFILDSPGSGYHFGALFTAPVGGSTGRNFSVNPTALYSGPSAPPTTTLASGGGSSGNPLDGNSPHLAGCAYTAGDLFAVPNTPHDGNYIVGRVDSVSASKAVLTYHIINFGGDYVPASSVAAETLTGLGCGLTINITSTTTANHTFDDTYGVTKAINAGIAAGGVTHLAPNCWVGQLMPPTYTVLTGGNMAPSYGYHPGIAIVEERQPQLNIIGTPSTYAIDYNGNDGIVLDGFRLAGFTGSGLASGTWTTTFGIGSSTNDRAPQASQGSGNFIPEFISNVSIKYFKYAVGTINAGDPLLFVNMYNNDIGANGSGGVYGALSDYVETKDTCASLHGYCVEITGGGGARIAYPRYEFAQGGIKFTGFGALHSTIIEPSMDHIVEAGILSTSQQISVTGGDIQGTGIGGTLSVSGAAKCAANNDVCLTVSSAMGAVYGGASNTFDLVTGDIANVTGINGTTEANGNQITLTVVDGNHIDLNGTTFSNAFTSSPNAVVAVNGKDAPVVLSSATGFFSSNVGFWGYAGGSNLPSGVLIDSVNSSHIVVVGNEYTQGTPSSSYPSYRQAIFNSHSSTNAPPSNVKLDWLGYTVDTSNPPTVTGLSLTSTGGGIKAYGGLSATTTSGATVVLSNLPTALSGFWDCRGGDANLGNHWEMTATTSTGCSLSATTSTGDRIWLEGIMQ